MADDKKNKDKKSDSWNFDPIEGAIVLIFLLSILGTLIPMILGYIKSGEISFFGYKLSNIIEFFKDHSFLFRALGFSITGLAAIGSFTLTKKGDAIWREEKAKLYPKEMLMSNSVPVPLKNDLTDKWQKIVAKSESVNESDWRLAIIEADIMLDDLLMQLQLPGETMGDKLKAVEPSDFLTLDQAWEAHKARNMIAHEGDFLINQREVRRIISLYEAVFKEFHMIQ